jgi:sulfate adenylyltransferase
VGTTKPGDVDHYTRVRCYQAVQRAYPPGSVALALLPLAMRMAGPREALWHAIIRRNYGCTHLIVGRDHAGPGRDAQGVGFYGPYDAQELLKMHEGEIGVQMIPSREMVYVPEWQQYVPDDSVPAGVRVWSVSGTELRRLLTRGDAIPDWFTFPDVIRELRRAHPPRSRQGFTVFFTGLSQAGKSTIANVLSVRLLEHGGRPVTLLDGDLVRRHLTSELGFSKAHRDLNIQRIGYVAAEITRHGGVAICAAIAPYDAMRRSVREMVEVVGGFVLVHVATPLDVCERRDRKGLYAKARAGVLTEFTGISDPYEAPTDADIIVNAAETSPEDAAAQILELLSGRGYVATGEELEAPVLRTNRLAR